MSSLWISFSIAAVLAVFYNIFKPRPLKHLKGPPSRSFFLGNQLEIRHQTAVGGFDFRCIPEYGNAWRVKGCFGEDILMIADPKGLQHILHTSGYHYPKTVDIDQINEFLLGRGLVAAGVHDHPRQRKVMNPAFSAAQLRSFLPHFRRSAAQLSQKLKEELQTASANGKVVNISKWLARTTLDVIGEAAFDYHFGALENSDNILMKVLDNLFADSFLYPPVWELMFKSFWRYIPRPILRLMVYLPTRESKRVREFLSTAKRIAKELVEEKAEAALGNRGGKDAMSILVQSNNSTDPLRKLDEDELLSQMATIIMAGHETTASSMTWLLMELARHPDDQRRVRDEIAAARARVVERGDEDFTTADLDGMEFTNAVMKETMRFHPIVPYLFRTAGRDDVIPLLTPLEGRSGEMISKIPVHKGQEVIISICGYNRLKSIWGEDADEWNPSRFLPGHRERETAVGVYANLLTFSAGIRACIGWRFSIIEMQAVFVELLENFMFSPPSAGSFSLPVRPDDDDEQGSGEKVEIQRVLAAIMVPMVKGRMDEGAQMPLRVKAI